MTLTIPGNPIPWQRAGSTRGRRFTKPETAAYQETIRFHARAAKAMPVTLPIAVNVAFFRRTRQRCDLDNLVKSVLDALNGVAYVDDSQVVFLTASKGVDAKAPRTQVTISVSAIGAA